MRTPRSRSVDDGDGDNARRQPFRPRQPPTTRTPTLTKSTPPRQAILTPRATPNPVRRKASSRKLKVKSEPPEIDLSKLRPPSPSDDPLLLSGTRSPPLRARFTPTFSSSPPISSPLVSFTARLSGRGADNSPTTDVHALPTFSAPRTVDEINGAWSDSDDDELNLIGEYTGKYKVLKVPTKAGPPTKQRVEPWGRPVSPFPYCEIMERSVLADVAEEGDDAVPCSDASMWEVATEPPYSDIETSPPPSVSEDEFAELDRTFPLFDVDAESTQIFPVKSQEPGLDSDQTSLEEQEEEEQIDRELSVALDDGPGLGLKAEHRTGEDTSDEEDDVKGEDIIKITSDDPKAAARAAAILRLHDYDCVLAAEKRKRSSRSSRAARKRRRTIENAGISKSYGDLRSQQWLTLQGGEISPGSRSLPLLELWRDAEDSVFLEHHSKSHCDTFFTLSPKITRPDPILPPPSAMWNRDCWKCLDKCLVAERLVVGASRGLGVDVCADLAEISKDAVLDRFVLQLGGESVLSSLGSDWSRDNLTLRLDLLAKKQSQRTSRAPMLQLARSESLDSIEPRYRGLLQEAMALSATKDHSWSSDAAVPSEGCNTAWSHPVTGADRHSPRPSPRSSLIHTPTPTPTGSGSPDPRLDRRWPLHPRDQVLRHASPARSRIPVSIGPKRLIDLRHQSPSKVDMDCNGPQRTRRNSGCSVRELVMQFEGLDG